jgi:ABC-type antimicrobial peptide transport system ATPase subunit
VLNVTAGKAKDVLVAIAEAANGHPHSDGVVVIADDATTDYDGTTKAAVYVHSGITSCGAITQVAAHS